MDTLRIFNEEKQKNWLKGIFALSRLRKTLESFTERETEAFHQDLRGKCGSGRCGKDCDLKNWKPKPKTSPPFDCDVCSAWRDEILINHTSPNGKVLWKNSEPHLWSQEKWEVAKVYMPDGHKNHKSIGDFDIAALLSLMTQCKHFKKFELGASCSLISNVRNNIMHSARFRLKREDLHTYLDRIRALGEELTKYDPEIKSLSEDIDEIQNLEFRLILPDNEAPEEMQAQHDSERVAVHLVSENHDTEDYLRRLVSECNKEIQTLHHYYRTELNRLREWVVQRDRKMENMHSAALQKATEHKRTKMKLKRLERQVAQREQKNMTEYYALTHIPRGVCMVINNEKFQGTQLRDRAGTQEDEKALCKVFTHLGFTMMVHNNLTAGAMRREIKQLSAKNFLDDDALVVCVLSHGEKGCVFGTDEQQVSLQELTQPFTSGRVPTLAGKPKLFFIQACQGSNYQQASVLFPPEPLQVEEEDGVSLLQEDARPVYGASVLSHADFADFLLGMATVPEYKSFRNTATGSIYIQQLCAQLMRSAKSSEEDDILTVLTRVNREVSKGQYITYKQMPEPKYTLTKKLVLKSSCGRDSWISGYSGHRQHGQDDATWGYMSDSKLLDFYGFIKKMKEMLEMALGQPLGCFPPVLESIQGEKPHVSVP